MRSHDGTSLQAAWFESFDKLKARSTARRGEMPMAFNRSRKKDGCRIAPWAVLVRSCRHLANRDDSRCAPCALVRRRSDSRVDSCRHMLQRVTRVEPKAYAASPLHR